MRASRSASPTCAPRPCAGEQRLDVIGEVQRDAAVALAERLDADPHHLAAPRSACRAAAARSRRCAPAGSRARAATATSGTPCSCSTTSSSASRPRRDRPMPVPATRNRPSTCGSTGSTSWRSRASERRRSAAQDLGVAPLAAVAAGPELALDDAAGVGQALQRARRPRAAPRPKRARDVAGGERAVRARVAAHQIADGIGDRLEQRLRQARAAAACRARRDSARRPRRRRAAPRRRCAPAATRRSATSSATAVSASPGDRCARASSSRVRSPRRSSRSCTASADRAWKRSGRCCSSSSIASSASASSSSRSSASPSSSRSCA